MQTNAQIEIIKEIDPAFLCFVASDRQIYYFIKRVVDLVVSLSLLLLLFPLMLLTAILIYIYSPGPIFFIQERVGSRRDQYGKYSYWKRQNFNCYKFRTMRLDADSAIHQKYVKALIENDQKKMSELQGGDVKQKKLINDPRIIQPGRILRKLSIDELPQLINVLRGDMSLIGPRPAIPYEVEVYKSWHLHRLEAQPGISGLQQISARCNVEFDEQIRKDIEYIQKQSIWLDMEIIFRTPLAILSTSGAH